MVISWYHCVLKIFGLTIPSGNGEGLFLLSLFLALSLDEISILFNTICLSL